MEQFENAGYHGGKVRISHIENAALAESIQAEIYKNIRRQMSSLDTAADFAATMLKKAVF